MLPDIRVRQRDYLLEIAQSITKELDLDILLQRILSLSVEIVGGHSGLIALNDDHQWKIQVTLNMPEAFKRYLDTVLPKIMDSKEHTGHDELQKFNHLLNELAKSSSALTGVGLPLIAQENVIGVIYIFRNSPGFFTNNDRSLLSSFADQAAIAVQNAQLYQSLNLQKQQTIAIIDSIADGMLVLAPNLTIQQCNPALSRLLTVNEEDILERSHSDVIRWAKPPSGKRLEDAVADGWPLTPYAQLYVEGDVIRQNDLIALPVGITYAPVISREGKLVNIVASVRDISHFRKADEIKSTFVSVVSHELKTPVALIKGYVSTLRRDDVKWDSEIVSDSLEVIEEEADHLAQMIEDLLDATRLQAGKLTVSRTMSDLKALVDEVVQKMQTQTRNHHLTVSFPDDFPLVLADENRIRQVLTNLISNAIKYAPGGEINVSGSTRPDKVIVCVTDEGPGIAPQDMPHIFDRFYRAPEMFKSTKGAGLGLYLSKSIIESHQGEMWINNEQKHGTRICFCLPKGG